MGGLGTGAQMFWASRVQEMFPSVVAYLAAQVVVKEQSITPTSSLTGPCDSYSLIQISLLDSCALSAVALLQGAAPHPAEGLCPSDIPNEKEGTELA